MSGRFTTDASGLCFLGCFWQTGLFRDVLAIAAAATLQYELAAVELAGLAAGAELTTGEAILNAGISGGVSGYISTGKLNGALMGSLESVAFAGVHFVKADFGINTGTIAGVGESAAIHGAVGGMFSVAQGGKFGSGFLAAGISDLGGSGDSQELDAIELSKHAIVGGLGSMLGGGKFGNGAVTGAFGYLLIWRRHTYCRSP